MAYGARNTKEKKKKKKYHQPTNQKQTTPLYALHLGPNHSSTEN